MTLSRGRIHESHHVARWCSTSRVDPETNWPKVSAFYLREDEDDLSTNWLGFYCSDRKEAVGRIRDNPPMPLTVGGRFVVLNVGQALDAVASKGASSPRVTHTPEDENPSHASFWWESIKDDHQFMAAELLVLVTSDDIYPGKLRPR